jgi:hypothetical protein
MRQGAGDNPPTEAISATNYRQQSSPTMYVLFGVVIALYVLALALRLYPWRDRPRRQRSLLAASVALGAAFGLLALGQYLTHARGWAMWAFVVLAVLFPVEGIVRARREK